MNIKDKFLELTSKTYPHGSESEVFSLLGTNLETDEFGNLYLKIGESDVMFTSHLDTATSAKTKVNHVIEGNIIKTDGTSILGADDKAGVTIMLYMIEKNIPGLYYFFLGEEVGCIGSRKLANRHREKKEGINKVISFDRRGTNSIITFQSSSRCCSDKFGSALAEALNNADSTFSYKNDPTGILTDSIQFVSIYSECTNISVGYQNEHTYSERQNIEHLEKLANACILIDWNSLPVERDPSTTEYSGYYGYGYECYGSEYDFEYPASKKEKYDSFDPFDPFDEPARIVPVESIWFYDEEFRYVSKIDKRGEKIVSVDIAEPRIEREKIQIEKFLKSIELDYQSINWDGLRLKVRYDFDYSTECTRMDLLEYIPNLDDFIKVEYSFDSNI